jgi:carbonic anhydrase/acetyltransferase-like protein (isoleucine patch superfamily)
MQYHKLIIGQSPWLELAAEDWLIAEPGLTRNLLAVDLDSSYGFDLSNLDNYNTSISTAFVAWGPKFINFQRMELMGELKKRGFKMPPLIHPSAQISSSAICYENAWVQANSVIEPNVTLGLNTHVGVGTKLSLKSFVGNHAWLGQDVRIGVGARVESHAIIGDGVVVADSVRIGRQTTIEVPSYVDTDWPDKSFKLLRSGLQGQIVEYSTAPHLFKILK